MKYKYILPNLDKYFNVFICLLERNNLSYQQEAKYFSTKCPCGSLFNVHIQNFSPADSVNQRSTTESSSKGASTRGNYLKDRILFFYSFKTEEVVVFICYW